MSNFSNCASTPEYFLAGSLGPICGGRGTCVNEVCVCDELWTGMADLFPLNSCQNPIVLDKLMWSFCAFMLLSLMFNARNIYRNQYRLFTQKQNVAGLGRRTRGNAKMFYAFTVCMVVALPALIAIFIARSATNLHFGVDLSITVAYVLAFSLYMSAIAVMDHEIFRITIHGARQLGENNKTEELVRIDRTSKFLGLGFYCGLTCGTFVGMVFLPIGVNPGRIALVICHNVGMMMYFGHYYWAHGQITSKLENILASLHAPSSLPSEDRFAKALLKLKTDLEQTKKTMKILFVLNIVFSVVPQLIPFVYVKNSFLLAASNNKGHSLLLLSKGDGADGDTDSNKKKVSASASSATKKGLEVTNTVVPRDASSAQ